MGQVGKSNEPMNLHALKLIREAFVKSKMTQADLAERSGVKRSTIANYLTKAGGNVYVPALIRIALALGEDPKTWITQIQSKHTAPTLARGSGRAVKGRKPSH